MMKIIDIKEFRKYWKTDENFIGFDENFIGAKHDKTNGFYRIVNGTVDDIKSDLTPKLQNAQDEQAVYEFLQNAADCQSSDFAIIFDEEYLMVINNGDPFTVENVKAILNSFQGTKYNKNFAENCDKIGRYGIGFKLVHRLVGKTDGANELIEKLDGPIIFSWHTKAQFDSLLNDNLEFETDHNLREGRSPWLFKIVLTCFPAMPQETVKGLEYQDEVIFQNDEFGKLQSFVSKNINKFNSLNLEKGSLFFLKFGENKHAKLEESLININSGISYSLNTLKKLNKVILHKDLINRKEIERVDFRIHTSEEEFKIIEPEFRECPIEILFGYLKDDFVSLRTSPNIFQYFPMRNENHGLSFFIHSTSFAKVTDRTKLDDQGDTNIQTFRVLCKKLEEILREDYQLKNVEKAKQIFQSIMYSEISKKDNSQLVLKELLHPLINYFSQNVPTKYGTFLPSNEVIIKDTFIDVDPSEFGIEKYWFAWENSETNEELISNVENKISLKKYSLKKLIEEGKIELINAWICKLSENDFYSFLSELEINPTPFLRYFKIVRLENGSCRTVQELFVENAIIKFPKIVQILDVLRSLGFSLSLSDFESYPRIKYKIAEEVDYLKEDSEAKLYKKIIASIEIANLNPEEKICLFQTLKSFKYIGEKTLSNELLLFSNRSGVKYPLSKLVNPDIAKEDWLDPFCIKDEELFEDIKSVDFLRGANTIYNDIIISNWSDIIKSVTPRSIVPFYQSVIRYYQATDEPQSIKNKAIIFCNNGEWLVLDKNIFFHNELNSFTQYPEFCEILDSIGLNYPPKELLKYLNEEPFNLQNSSTEALLVPFKTSISAFVALFNFMKGKLNIFDYGYVESCPEGIEFKPDSSNRQFYSDDHEVISYVLNHCDNTLIALPSVLASFKDQVRKGEHLYSEIITISKTYWSNNEGVLNELLNLLVNSGLRNILKRFVSEANGINLSLMKFEENTITTAWLRVIFSAYDLHELGDIREKIKIDDIKLSELTWNNIVKLDDKNEIELGSLLDKFNENKTVALLRKKILELNVFENNKIDALFSTTSSPNPDNLIDIFEEVLSIQNKQIANSDQLKLAIFLFKKNLIKSLEGIKVLALDGEWYDLYDHWYLKDIDFISKNAILDPVYKEVSFESFGNASIIRQPYFNRIENRFICPHLKENLNDIQLISFFNLIKEQIIKNAQFSNNWLDELFNVIGFSPKIKIFADDNFIHQTEKLPAILSDWAKESNENLIVLKAIGCHTYDSPIVRLRKYFFEESNDYSFEGFSKLNEYDIYLLTNTISLISIANVIFDDEKGSIIKMITELIRPINDISHVKLPIAVKVSGNQLHFQLKTATKPYLLTQEFISQYPQAADKLLPNFLQYLIDNQISIVDPDCLSVSWQNAYTELLQWSEPEVDIEVLEAESQPVDLECYLKWKSESESEIEIKFINSSVNHKTTINGLDDYYLTSSAEDYYYDEESQILYTTRQAYEEAVWATLRDLIPEEEINRIVNKSSLVIHSDEDIETLKKQIKYLKDQLEHIDPGYGESPGTQSKESQIDWSKEAKDILKSKLSEIPEFDISGWDDSAIPSSIVTGIKYLGKNCKFIIRSAMSDEEKFHLTPKEWLLFSDKNVFLALRLSVSEIKIYGIGEDIKKVIFKNNPTISLNFKNELFSIDGADVLSALLVKYNVYGSGFVFRNPNYSAGQSLDELSNCKEGILEKFEDDAL